MSTELIKLDNGYALGIKIDMYNAPLILIKAHKGFIMCGYLNLETSETLGDVAAVVKNVNSFNDMLTAPVISFTSSAHKLGVKEGITGKQALELLC
ncbi:DUF1805 domain-containing protein [Methanosalsum natronophilum]|uniref:DUF1805 domain-containing protein n=2 Tax=Methanosalsum natronophilum TaxID=768733 RepID=A0A3R7XCY0_9EURY|nr:uncharacterized protein YunC (DUF1805 family) [Methanosalsum natronophilum]RQD79928.1 MAG: DUF1805 domain-containing protein [Methanosalsum natronophilum]